MSLSEPVADSRRPTVGRHRERAALTAVIEQAEAGHGVAAVVTGDAGIGKTTLLAGAASEAGHYGVRVLRCSGVQAEANIAFALAHPNMRKGVLSMLERLIADLEPEAKTEAAE